MITGNTRGIERFILSMHTYRIRSGMAQGLKRLGGAAFRTRVLTAEESFLIRLDLQGKTVFDVGGHEGVFTLFFARAVGKNGRVFAFEPNPRSYKCIKENIKLNQFENVIVGNLALGSSVSARANLVFCSDSPGTGSLQSDIQSNLVKQTGTRVIEVEIDTVDHNISSYGLPVPDFVNIDVEGFELEVLRGMTQTIIRSSPRVYIEVRGADLEKKTNNIQEIVTFLSQRKYSIHHVKSNQLFTTSNTPIAKEGHLYCVATDR